MTMTTLSQRPLPRLTKAIALAALLGLAAACSTTSPDVIKPGDAQRMSNVQDAVVLSVRPVVVEGQQSGAGAITGGVVGSIAGGSVGGRRESSAVGVLGAAAGAVIGNAIERFGTREEAVEVLVQLPNGDRRSLVQAKGLENLSPGDPVLLISSGGRTRLMKAPAVMVTPTAPASPNAAPAAR